MIGLRYLGLLLLSVGFLPTAPVSAEWPRPNAPSRAERALTARGFDIATAALLELVRTGTDLEARIDALRVLSSRPREEVNEPLVELLATESDPIVRRETAIALAWLGDLSALEILRISMRETLSEGDRIYLAETLASFGDVETVPVLTASLDSQDAFVRADALRALVGLALRDIVVEPPLDVPALLLEALEDPAPGNRRTALNLVADVVERGTSADHFRSAVERLAAEDPVTEVRDRAALILRLLDSLSDERIRELRDLLRKRYQERLRDKGENPPPP